MQKKTQMYAAALALAAIVPLGACNKSESTGGPGGMGGLGNLGGNNQSTTSNGGTSVLGGSGSGSGSGLGSGSGSGSGLGSGSGSGLGSGSGSGSGLGSGSGSGLGSGSGSGLGSGSGGLGSSSSSSYCSAIRSADSSLSGMSSLSPTDKAAMQRFVTHFKRIEAAAPPEIKGDWNTMTSALEMLASGDLSAAGSLDPTSIDRASKNIESHVKRTCGITLK